MSFSGRTPESLLPRSDSRNPATTCRGITTTGRPCRRPLAASPKNSPAPSPSRGHNGVLAMLDEQHAAAFYCWQHKDQAEQLAAAPGGGTSLHPLKERSSIDTLIEQVGILDLDENVPKRHHRRHESDSVRRRDTLPSGWNQMESPLMTVPDEVVHHRRPKWRPAPPPPPQSNVKLSWACCIQADHDDDLPPARVRREDRDGRPPRPHTDVRRPTSSGRPEMRQSHTPATRPKPSPAPSQTQTLLSLIPSNLSPQVTSQLLAELIRPISAADEAGYIYIFWLTPESEVSKPDDETASSLLDEDEDDLYNGGGGGGSGSQRTTQALARYASVRRPPNQVQPKRTITLKIGRAANVHRRMAQWTKQCGQNITLVRYYPHSARASGNSNTHTPRSPLPPSAGGVSSSSAPPPSHSNKVSHMHKVERLIHLELSEKKAIKSECEQCGREHKEWFEIDATRAGLRSVDEVVRRWVAWAERQ